MKTTLIDDYIAMKEMDNRIIKFFTQYRIIGIQPDSIFVVASYDNFNEAFKDYHQIIADPSNSDAEYRIIMMTPEFV